MAARSSFNSKRRIQAKPMGLEAQTLLEGLAKRARYVGSPLHKRNPADFGLEPPVAPRQGKTLCDGAVDCREDAQRLLAEGLGRGLISEQVRNGWPQNVWAVTENGVALEAQLDNVEQGSYHGYPMTDADPLCDQVLDRWRTRT